jgi:hypothetical protein
MPVAKKWEPPVWGLCRSVNLAALGLVAATPDLPE